MVPGAAGADHGRVALARGRVDPVRRETGECVAGAAPVAISPPAHVHEPRLFLWRPRPARAALRDCQRRARAAAGERDDRRRFQPRIPARPGAGGIEPERQDRGRYPRRGDGPGAGEWCGMTDSTLSSQGPESAASGQILPVDRYHTGVRMASLALCFVMIMLFYLIGRILFSLVGGEISGGSLLVLVVGAIVLAQPVARWGEKQLVARWTSGRSVRLESDP